VNCKRYLLRWECGKTENRAPVRVSSECICRNAGRPLVASHRPRHDATRISQLQPISGVLRRNRDEYSGGPPTKIGQLWNYHDTTGSVGWTKINLPSDGEGDRSRASSYRDGPVGRGARKDRQSATRPTTARRQRDSYRRSAKSLGRPAFSPILTSLLLGQSCFFGQPHSRKHALYS
jgi:hypothetical protein